MDYYARIKEAQAEINGYIRAMNHGEKIKVSDLLMKIKENYGLQEKFLNKTLDYFKENDVIMIQDGIIERA